MSVDQKLAMLKISSTSVTFSSLCNLKAAPEEAMQLRRLMKSSNEICLGNLSFGIFRAPRGLQYLEKPGSNMVKTKIFSVSLFAGYIIKLWLF